MARRLADLDRRERTRKIVLAAVRIVLVWVLLATCYYTVPLEDISGNHPAALVTTIVLVFGAVFAWATLRVLKADLPQLRAAEAVGFTVPFFLTLFAIVYLVLAQPPGQNFSERLDRVSALYFTITVFATVGFGDITATSQGAQLVVSLQMLLDLVVLGVVVKVLFGAARRGIAKAEQDSAP
jgi:CDP-diglyceride synthetase